MNKLQGKKLSSSHSIEFSLHKDVPYLQQTTANKVFLANEAPFTNYKVGDYLGIDVSRTSLRFPDAEQGKIWKDSAVVVRVVKDESPSSHKTVYNSEEFGDGWVEE